MWLACLLTVTGLLSTVDASGAILTNGGFEVWTATRPAANGLVSGWQLDSPPQLATAWTLNTAYPGQLLVGQTTPRSGKRFARIVGVNARGAHLYQMCRGLQGGAWYRVSAWTRGGPVTLCCYEYGKAKFLGSPSVAQRTVASDQWRLTTGYYRPSSGEFRSAALAICVAPGDTVDIDDVAIEPIDAGPVAATAADVVLETETARVVLSPTGVLREFCARPAGENYAAEAAPFGILSVVRNGVPTPLRSLTRHGDRLEAQFLDPELRATLRVKTDRRHLALEVLDVQPADVEQLSIEFPVRRLAKVGTAFNATYDERFGACLFGTSVNVFNRPRSHGRDVFGMGAACTQKHKLTGARFALVAAPAAQFSAAIIEAERAGALPCPMLGGRWARESEAVRHSYLFMVDAAEANIDRTIEYAKLGGFRMIIFLKDNWLASHGHYEINRRNFPDGLASLKRTVDKIHAAGLDAGVHVFGPSISPSDPYVTPRPDPRLASIACPPLAEAVDAKSQTLTLSAVPDLPPKRPRSAAFPGYHVRVGDELVRYQELELGPPVRLTGCQRGALGTAAAAHPAGTAVRGMLSLWGYFLVDPDSTLADEVVRNFGRVVNHCGFDMVYFDASDGILDAYLDRWYYLNRMHLGFYRQLHKDVLYQTSNGTGTDLCWHLIPRSASADGHGDLKGYLDQRWRGILGMGDNWTRPDVGWYYIFTGVRPDQIEYVCAKVLGIDGSISIETSQAALERHVYGRRMVDMLGRYERCRLDRAFPAAVRERLLEPGRDFRLLGAPGSWQLCQAVYETPRVVERLDGQQNVWIVRNDRSEPCDVAVELTGGTRDLPTTDYDHPRAVTIETFDDAAPYQPAQPVGAQPRESRGMQYTFSIATVDAPRGPRSAVWSARNTGDHGGWAAVERRFAQPLNLAGQRALALWVHGDGSGVQLRIQLRDLAGRVAAWLVPLDFHGWRLCAYRVAGGPKFDWSKLAGVEFRIQAMPVGVSTTVGLDDLRALPEAHPAGAVLRPTLDVNGRRLLLAPKLIAGQGLTADRSTGLQRWTGAMQPGERLAGDASVLTLHPGENRITFSAEAAYPGDVTVLISRFWPLATATEPR